MQKKLLKILSVLALTVGVFETLWFVLAGAVSLYVLYNKDLVINSDKYIEYINLHNFHFAIFGTNAADFGVFVLFGLTLYMAAAAIGHFIYGISGLKAVKGIKIKRARIIGTAALVIAVCEMIEQIFVLERRAGLYSILYILLSVLFLYCVNSIRPEKR